MQSLRIKSLLTFLATGLFSILAWAVQPVNVNTATAEEIAEALKISATTVPTYVRRIYEKLHVHSRSQAVAKVAHWLPR